MDPAFSFVYSRSVHLSTPRSCVSSLQTMAKWHGATALSTSSAKPFLRKLERIFKMRKKYCMVFWSLVYLTQVFAKMWRHCRDLFWAMQWLPKSCSYIFKNEKYKNAAQLIWRKLRPSGLVIKYIELLCWLGKLLKYLRPTPMAFHQAWKIYLVSLTMLEVVVNKNMKLRILGESGRLQGDKTVNCLKRR